MSMHFEALLPVPLPQSLYHYIHFTLSPFLPLPLPQSLHHCTHLTLSPFLSSTPIYYFQFLITGYSNSKYPGQTQMVSAKEHNQPEICYRPIRHSDRETLEHIHDQVFPDRHDPAFYEEVLNGRNNMSWGAVDRNRPDGQSDEVVGYVTTNIIPARESEIANNIVGPDPDKSDQTLVYVSTLGVVEAYRNRGIASCLMREVIKYASSIPTCRAVYLHAIADNKPAIKVYKKMSFKCVRRLRNYYPINGKHYDGCLFVYCVNGGRYHRSPKDLVELMLGHMRSGLKAVAARLLKNEGRHIPWQKKSKESHPSVSAAHDKGNLASECIGHGS